MNIKKHITLKNCICFILILFSIFYFAQMCLSDGTYVSKIDGLTPDDVFNKFFESICAVYEGTFSGSYVYHETPLTSLFYLLIGSVIPNSIKTNTDTLKYVQQGSLVCMFFICIWYLLFCLLLVYQDQKYNLIILLFTLPSVPFLYVFQNGGYELCVLFLTTYYLSYYNSSNSAARKIAHCCIAVAAALKIYPVLFFLMSDSKPAKIKATCISLFLIVIPIIVNPLYSIPMDAYLFLLWDALVNYWYALLMVICWIFIIIKGKKIISSWMQILGNVLIICIICYAISPEVYVYLVLPLTLCDTNLMNNRYEKYIQVTCVLILLLVFSPFLNTFGMRLICCCGAMLLVLFYSYIIYFKNFKNLTR